MQDFASQQPFIWRVLNICFLLIAVQSVVEEQQATLFTKHKTVVLCFVMVALWNRADHYIFILSFDLLSSFFPCLFSSTADWMSAILPHMVWP